MWSRQFSWGHFLSSLSADFIGGSGKGEKDLTEGIQEETTRIEGHSWGCYEKLVHWKLPRLYKSVPIDISK